MIRLMVWRAVVLAVFAAGALPGHASEVYQISIISSLLAGGYDGDTSVAEPRGGAVLAAKQATSVIPIVFAAAGDPVVVKRSPGRLIGKMVFFANLLLREHTLNIASKICNQL